jgi:DNA helicase-2/ATP-dependent DNA helicase PcrA
MSKPWLEGLNPAQRNAVTYGSGPLLIVAGAGTGKTRTLACRVAHLIDSGVSPDRILLLTFTRRASGEMLSRAAKLINRGSAGGKVWGGTFHAVANRLLRTYHSAVDLPAEFTVMDEGDAGDLMNLIRGELGLSKKDRRFPRKQTLVKIYSHMVNAHRPLDKTLELHFPWCQQEIDGVREVLEHYVQRKKEQAVLDYDDLLLYWAALTGSGAGEKIADRFEHILVDEYQDTNAIQAEILLGMRRKYNSLTVVGDDAQSIYSFRAATIRNILNFPDQYPGTRVVTLEQNYRSTQPILAAANAVMEPAKERYTKELWSDRKSDLKPAVVSCSDESQQTDIVCRNILEHYEQGIPLMRQSVLFRASHHSAMLEIELAKRNIPFHKYGGLKFIEAAHIKDVLALLRMLENPFDEISWFRVLHWFDGVGPRTARRVMDELGVRRILGEPQQENHGNPVVRLLENVPSVPSAARRPLGDLRAAFADCLGCSPTLESDAPRLEARGGSDEKGGRAGRTELALPSQIERIRVFYEPICEKLYDNTAVRLRDIDQLAGIASRYRSRQRFITDLTLDPPISTSDLAQAPHLDEDFLILSTIHSAKGCEWDVVHILHAADGMIPSDMATRDEDGVDEERRLFYVAMTRAKDVLYIYFPLRYYHHRFGLGDGHGYAQLTRFLHGLSPELLTQEQAGEIEGMEDGSQLSANIDPRMRVGRLLEK